MRFEIVLFERKSVPSRSSRISLYITFRPFRAYPVAVGRVQQVRWTAQPIAILMYGAARDIIVCGLPFNGREIIMDKPELFTDDLLYHLHAKYHWFVAHNSTHPHMQPLFVTVPIAAFRKAKDFHRLYDSVEHGPL